MTGRDVPTRQKTLSVAFSVIMVLSVVAMGVAGLAGSAAAASQSDTDSLSNGSGYIFADPANASQNATHTIQVQVGSDVGNISQGSNLTVSYGNDVDISGLTNVSASQGGDISEGANSTNLYVNDTVVTNANVSFGDSSNTIEYDPGKSAPTVKSGDILTFEIGVNGETLRNPSQASTDVNVSVSGASNTVDFNSANGNALTLAMGEGPIEVNQGGTTFFFNTLDRGIGNATNGDTVTITSDLDETLPTQTPTAIVNQPNVIVEGSGSPVINVSGYGNTVLDLGGNNNITVDGLTFEGSDLTQTAITSAATANTTISGNTFQNIDSTTVSITTASPNADDDTLTLSNNVFTGDQGGAIFVDANSLGDNNDNDEVIIDSNDITLDSGAVGIDIVGDSGGGNVGQVTLSSNTVDGNSNAATGIRLVNGNSIEATVDVTGGSINATNVGIDASSGNNVTGAFLNISDTEFTNQAVSAVDVSAGGFQNQNLNVNIDGISVDSSSNANGVLLSDTADQVGNVSIDNAVINDTNIAIAMNSSDVTQTLNITNSEITNADNAGFQVNNNASGLSANLHFNTFSSNEIAMDINQALDAGSGDFLNATFNDITSNTNGLDAVAQGTRAINANYSYWGAPTGPDGDDSVSGAYGDGGNVTLDTDSDASVYPFLTESISQFSDAELNGDSFVVLENPQFPIEGTSNNQAIGVTVLEFGNSQATADNVTLQGPTGQRVLDGSTQLDPTTIEQFNLSSDVSAGEVTINAVSKADAISDGSVTQTVTGQFNASTSTLTDDNSQLQSGQTVNFTLQLNDDAGNAHEHQGVAVDFASQNFGTAGVQFTDTEANTSNEGTATATIAASGLEPGEDFTVRAFVGPDDDVFERTLTTATGAVDAGSSRLLLNDQLTDPATQQVNTTHDLAAQINDSQDNPVSGETVTFSSNASGVSFESTDVSTDSDGFANTTVTLPTDVGGVALNASAGDFSADTTGSARINVSTTAADASQLNVSDVSIAPGNSNPATVSVQDEFGNLNTSTPDITLNTTDQSVISINGQQEATNTSTSSGQATFTITAESDSGSATLTASASGLTADTATASIAEVGGVSLTADDSSIINDASSDNATNFTAEVTDADGNVIQTNESIRFTRVTGSSDAAASSTGAFEVFSGDDGTVTTFRANATGTGDTTFQANIPGSSFTDTATITSTGTADGLTIEANQSTVTAGDKVQINLSVVDTGDRVVPVSRSLSVDTTLGTLDSSGAATTVSTTDGEANVTLNATEAGTADVTVANSGLQTSVTTSITVEEQEQLPDRSITFDDKTVGNTSTDITVESATFNGSQSFNIVVHEATRNDDGTVNIGQKIGESVELDNGTQTDITVNISKQVDNNDTVSQLTESQTLVAMLHTTNTSDDDGIVHTAPIREDGTENTPPVFDDANITVSPLEGTTGDFDSDGDGELSVNDVGDAASAFIDGDLSIQDISRIAAEFIN